MTGQQEKNSFERGQVVWLPNTDVSSAPLQAIVLGPLHFDKCYVWSGSLLLREERQINYITDFDSRGVFHFPDLAVRDAKRRNRMANFARGLRRIDRERRGQVWDDRRELDEYNKEVQILMYVAKQRYSMAIDKQDVEDLFANMGSDHRIPQEDYDAFMRKHGAIVMTKAYKQLRPRAPARGSILKPNEDDDE